VLQVIDMIHEVDANLLEYPVDGIVHQANCFHTMGGGIARRIKEKFPEAYHADVSSATRGTNRLGTFSMAVLPSNFHIYNLYGQYNFGEMVRQTSYDALCLGLEKIEKHARENGLKSLGVPKRMGCVLGGGSWNIVRAIIGDIFDNSPIELHICNYEG
jgi:O-acetyl-ADP-ribose deacetylase (regulator of RNase III)